MAFVTMLRRLAEAGPGTCPEDAGAGERGPARGLQEPESGWKREKNSSSGQWTDKFARSQREW